MRHLPVAGGGDGGHVEQLTGVIVDAAEHHHSDGVALLLDDPQDVLRPQSLLALKKSKLSVGFYKTKIKQLLNFFTLFLGKCSFNFNLANRQRVLRCVRLQYRAGGQQQHAVLGVEPSQADLRLDGVLRRRGGEEF